MDIITFKKWWIEKGCPGRYRAMEMYEQDFKKPITDYKMAQYIRKCRGAKVQVSKAGASVPVDTTFRDMQLKLDFKTNEKLLKFIEHEKTVEEIKNHFKVTESEITARLKELRHFYNINIIGNIIRLEKSVIPIRKEFSYNWDGNKILKFGVVSDNHLCNQYQQLTFLHELYGLFEKEGVKTVFNAGDISDGYYKHRAEHIYDLIPGCIGVDDQVEYIAKNYPRIEGITTKVISGNHDETHIINGGADLVKRLSVLRSDIENLGHGDAVVNITDNCKIELLHPLDGASYALSYSAQRYVDSIQGGEKPNILIVGHHHKAMYFIHRNIHILEAGTTCGQTLWMKRKKIMANVGGWILTIHLDDEGTIRKFIPEFIPLYKMKKEDY